MWSLYFREPLYGSHFMTMWGYVDPWYFGRATSYLYVGESL